MLVSYLFYFQCMWYNGDVKTARKRGKVMKKLPYGISNYEELIEDGYYYVDKTPYIEKLKRGEENGRRKSRRDN